MALKNENSEINCILKQIAMCSRSYYQFLNQNQATQQKPYEFDFQLVEDQIKELDTYDVDIQKAEEWIKAISNEFKLEEFQEKLNQINKYHPGYSIYNALSLDQLLFVKKIKESEINHNQLLLSSKYSQYLQEQYSQPILLNSQELALLKNEKNQVGQLLCNDYKQQLLDISQILSKVKQQVNKQLYCRSLSKNKQYSSQSNKRNSNNKLAEIQKQLTDQKRNIQDVQNELQDYSKEDLKQFKLNFEKYQKIKQKIQSVKSQKQLLLKNFDKEVYSFNSSLNQQIFLSDIENSKDAFDDSYSLNQLSKYDAEQVCDISIQIEWLQMKQNQEVLNKFCILVQQIYYSYFQLINNFISTNRQIIQILKLSVEIHDIKPSDQYSYKSKLFQWCQKIDNQISEADKFNSKKRILAIHDNQIENECQISGKDALFQQTISQIEFQYIQIFQYIAEKKRVEKQKLKEQIINEICNEILNLNKIQNLQKKIKDLCLTILNLEDQITDLNKQNVNETNKIQNLIEKCKKKNKQKSDLEVDLVNLQIDYQKNNEQDLELIAKIVNSFIESICQQSQYILLNYI
ncbi:hypothetical protein ABPG72_000509 [Tetrahymena utriculariae]